MSVSTTSTPGVSSNCYTIDRTTITMKDFIGYPMFKDPNNNVRDTTTLDAYIFTQMDNDTEYVVNFKAAYDCPNWNGSDQRFHMSYYQGLLTFLAQNSKSVTPCTTTTTGVNRFVCQSTCKMARDALAGIFANPKSCNVNANPTILASRQATLATYDKNCAQFPTTNCIPVVQLEASQAGFPLLKDGEEHCRREASDPLCSMLQTEDRLRANDPAFKKFMIAGIVLGVLVTGGLIAAAFLCLRNKGTKRVARGADGKFVDLDNQENGGSTNSATRKEPKSGNLEITKHIMTGLSAGLSVPFALTAGLAAIGNSRFVVVAGILELVAGAISMGLGGYLTGKDEVEVYIEREAREWQEVMNAPDAEEQLFVDIFTPYGLSREDMEPLLRKLRKNPELWVEFMMVHDLGIQKPDKRRLWLTALATGGSYFMGGLVPLIPYTLVPNTNTAQIISVAATLVVLFLFGLVKARVLGVGSIIQSAFELFFVGAAASGIAFGVAKLLPSPTQ
ncbi:hypothetical protein HDU81_007906 [Chytriomyces hyalinus]|nr:hypothetical protein HDU81_007906 [Chytriomyces hyalinus]